VICNEEDTNGRARVIVDEERVLHVDLADTFLHRYRCFCFTHRTDYNADARSLAIDDLLVSSKYQVANCSVH